MDFDSDSDNYRSYKPCTYINQHEKNRDIVKEKTSLILIYDDRDERNKSNKKNKRFKNNRRGISNRNDKKNTTSENSDDRVINVNSIENEEYDDDEFLDDIFDYQEYKNKYGRNRIERAFKIFYTCNFKFINNKNESNDIVIDRNGNKYKTIKLRMDKIFDKYEYNLKETNYGGEKALETLEPFESINYKIETSETSETSETNEFNDKEHESNMSISNIDIYDWIKNFINHKSNKFREYVMVKENELKKVNEFKEENHSKKLNELKKVNDSKKYSLGLESSREVNMFSRKNEKNNEENKFYTYDELVNMGMREESIYNIIIGSQHNKIIKVRYDKKYGLNYDKESMKMENVNIDALNNNNKKKLVKYKNREKSFVEDIIYDKNVSIEFYRVNYNPISSTNSKCDCEDSKKSYACKHILLVKLIDNIRIYMKRLIFISGEEELIRKDAKEKYHIEKYIKLDKRIKEMRRKIISWMNENQTLNNYKEYMRYILNMETMDIWRRIFDSEEINSLEKFHIIELNITKEFYCLKQYLIEQFENS